MFNFLYIIFFSLFGSCLVYQYLSLGFLQLPFQSNSLTIAASSNSKFLLVFCVLFYKMFILFPWLSRSLFKYASRFALEFNVAVSVYFFPRIFFLQSTDMFSQVATKCIYFDGNFCWKLQVLFFLYFYSISDLFQNW